MTHRELLLTQLTLREARGRLCRYLQAIGYRVQAGMDREMTFKRKSPLGWLPGSAPRAWNASVRTSYSESPKGTHVLVEWSISTRGRNVAIWDREYFKREAQGAVRTVAGTPFSLKKLERYHLSAALKSLIVYLAVFIVTSVATAFALLRDIPFLAWALTMAIVTLLLVAIRVPVRRPRRRLPDQVAPTRAE